MYTGWDLWFSSLSSAQQCLLQALCKPLYHAGAVHINAHCESCFQYLFSGAVRYMIPYSVKFPQNFEKSILTKFSRLNFATKGHHL